MKSLLLYIFLTAISAQFFASVITIGAKGTGWCSDLTGNSGFPPGYCNNIDLTNFRNNDVQSSINNWQSFALSTPGPAIASATLSIFEAWEYESFPSGSGEINFYIASGLSFEGLQHGPSIGTILTGTSLPPGRYFNITLNDYGIQQLNVLQGRTFIIGGSGGGHAINAFGFTEGFPAPYLTLDHSAVVYGEVPEPSSAALLGLGVLNILAFRTRKRRKSAPTARATIAG